MRDENKTKSQLISELREFRQQLEEQRATSRSDRASSALMKSELTSDLLQAKKDLSKSLSETAVSDKALGESEKALHISQQNLSDAHNRYNILSDLVPFGVWTADAQGNITFLSDIFLEMSGIKIEDTSKLEWIDQLSRPAVSSAISDWSNPIHNRDFREGEFPITSKTGQKYFILIRGVPMLDKEGQISSWLGINLDITERKRAEEAMAKQKQIMARAEDMADLGSWEWNIKEDTWLLSNNWKKIHGCSDIELTTSQVIPIAHHEDKSFIEDAFSKALE